MKAPDVNRQSNLVEFGPFRLDPVERTLLRDGEPVAIPPKAFDTLLVLVEHSGRAVKKDDLIAAVWPDTFVEENNLTQYVSLLRKTLGGNGDGHRFIETVPRWGYRFVGDVREVWDEREELTVHRRTRSSVVIREEEHTEPTPSRPRRVAILATVAGALAVACLVAAAYVWGTSRANPTAAPAVRSLAVLPFESFGGDRDESAYLEVAMADAVITRLGRLKRISVRSTSAVRAYAGSPQDPVAVGHALNVDAILEGHIQKAADRIRVTVRLLSARDGAPMWTEQFDEEAANVFALQDAIAARVARGLAPVLDGEELRPSARPTANAKAYEAYLKGRYLWSKRTTESVRASIDCFQQAIDADPNFALAYVGLADAYAIQAAPLVEPQLQKALALDDTIGEAHASLGFYRMFWHWDLPLAERELRLAIELSPNYATAHQWYALLLAVRGRFDEAKAEMATAIECDPVSPNMRADMAEICRFAGEPDAAIAHCREALELDPNFLFAHINLAATYEQERMYAEAVDETIWCMRSGGTSEAIVAEHRDAFAKSGWPGFCRTRIAHNPNAPLLQTISYLQLGEPDRAIAALQKGCERRDFFMIFAGVDPRLAPLHSDPRFVEIARTIGAS